ncbi:hypothetical protein COBT_002930 [Conglomerata obtusa]
MEGRETDDRKVLKKNGASGVARKNCNKVFGAVKIEVTNDDGEKCNEYGILNDRNRGGEDRCVVNCSSSNSDDLLNKKTKIVDKYNENYDSCSETDSGTSEKYKEKRNSNFNNNIIDTKKCNAYKHLSEAKKNNKHNNLDVKNQSNTKYMTEYAVNKNVKHDEINDNLEYKINIENAEYEKIDNLSKNTQSIETNDDSEECNHKKRKKESKPKKTSKFNKQNSIKTTENNDVDNKLQYYKHVDISNDDTENKENNKNYDVKTVDKKETGEIEYTEKNNINDVSINKKTYKKNKINTDKIKNKNGRRTHKNKTYAKSNAENSTDTFNKLNNTGIDKKINLDINDNLKEINKEYNKELIERVTENSLLTIKKVTTENIENLNATFDFSASNEPIKIPKKRGRKKKIVDENSIPAKRGRKKKSEMTAVTSSVIKTIKEEPVKKIVNKKDKVTHFLNKDQFQILYPEDRPFKNKKHAIECLIPYHTLGDFLYEDLQYFAADDFEELEDVNSYRFKELCKKYNENMIKFDNNYHTENNLVIDILKTEEIKFKCYKAKRKIDDDKLFGNRRNNVKIKLIYNEIEKDDYKIYFKIDRDYFNCIRKK